jgi:hypothetical protein
MYNFCLYCCFLTFESTKNHRESFKLFKTLDHLVSKITVQYFYDDGIKKKFLEKPFHRLLNSIGSY